MHSDDDLPPGEYHAFNEYCANHMMLAKSCPGCAWWPDMLTNPAWW